MAQINFPAASESPWYNPDNGVTYEYIDGTWRTVTTASQLDDIYVKEIGDIMTGELVLHGNPAQALGATPKQYVDTEITNAISSSEGGETGRLDGRYLRKDSAAGNQTVESTGTTEFDGNVYVVGNTPNFFRSNTHIGGTKADLVNSNAIDLIGSGAGISGTIRLKGFNFKDSGTSDSIRGRGIIYSQPNDALLSVNTPSVADSDVTVFLGRGDARAYADNGTISPLNATEINCFKGVFPLASGNDGTWDGYKAFSCIPGVGTARWSGNDNVYGFYSFITDEQKLTSRTYNFYAEANAPNFFKGNTYIAGNTTRSTRELWESTLTEEQKEQLAAETLAIPANVSSPGDGSFARQWWYDQQDAETQAELDAGTLEYPTHLAAATFTDTFVLGDNTNINLLSSGIVQNSGIEFIGNKTSASVDSRGIVYSSSKKALLSTNKPNNADDNVDVFLARTDNTEYETDGTRTPVNIARGTSFKAESPLGNSAGEYGSYDSYVGFHATAAGNSDNDAVWTGNDNSYGFLSGLSSRTGTGGGQTYGFYASGNAPNYFSGGVQFDTAAGTDALSHYEEGSFTLTLNSASNVGGAGDSDILLTSVNSEYIIIGNQVHVQFSFRITDTNGDPIPGNFTGNEQFIFATIFGPTTNSLYASAVGSASAKYANDPNSIQGQVRFAGGTSSQQMKVEFTESTGNSVRYADSQIRCTMTYITNSI